MIEKVWNYSLLDRVLTAAIKHWTFSALSYKMHGIRSEAAMISSEMLHVKTCAGQERIGNTEKHPVNGGEEGMFI